MNFEYFYKTIGYELNSWILDMLRKRGVVMPPRFVAWDSTRRCNLNCEHCGAKKEIYPKELSTDEIKIELIELIKKYRKKWRRKIKIDLGENAAYLGEYDHQARIQPFFCPVGFSTCCIGADGNVRGCPEQPDTEYFREGNILQKSFKEIWENGFKKYRDDEYLKDDVCAHCEYHKKCRGGCWVNKVKGKICAAKEYC
ncbi:MAG: SPASM domain-containing protein [Candidatus Magasanikbacteria bacterium]|jgi:radical SAM protein with 4Fe4S-binding SPASM domain